MNGLLGEREFTLTQEMCISVCVFGHVYLGGVLLQHSLVSEAQDSLLHHLPH